MAAGPGRGEGVSTSGPKRWRVGRKVGRTLYAMVGDEPSDDDQLIGMMDTPELARSVVTAREAHLAVWRMSLGEDVFADDEGIL